MFFPTNVGAKQGKGSDPIVALQLRLVRLKDAGELGGLRG